MTPIEFAESKQDEFLNELLDFLRIPSISTDKESAPDVRRAADWLVSHLKGIGLKTVELHETGGHPIVYAEHLEAPGKPTVLLYGHYDVQPPDPLELWDSPPFEPVVKDGKIFARGATDDKGQSFAHVKGLEAHLKATGTLPVNVKILIEGEEEVGSVHLDPWVEANREKLSCDAVVISDSSMYARGLPAIMYSLRGLAYFEIELEGADHDLHSGLFGGAIPNPINELGRLIASFHDEKGHIAIPGFYDAVRELSQEERDGFAALPFNESEFVGSTGASAGKGEAGFTSLERVWARPTLDFNGIIGGFTGEGAKTVLPSKVRAKFSCRLVPDQTPKAIEELVAAHIRQTVHPSLKVKIEFHHGGRPVMTERDHFAVNSAMGALKKAWGVDPVFIRGGGSIPVVATFSDVLKVPTVLIGLGLNDDRLHSPNEKFDLENFFNGIKTSVYLWDELAQS